MAICESCDQEMTLGVGCTVTRYGGEDVDRIPHTGDSACHDCGAPPETQHHPGCDGERCPVCDGQAIACECTSVDDDEDVEEAPTSMDDDGNFPFN